MYLKGNDWSIDMYMTCCCDSHGNEVKYGEPYHQKGNCNACWCGKGCTYRGCPI